MMCPHNNNSAETNKKLIFPINFPNDYIDETKSDSKLFICNYGAQKGF